MVVLALSRNPCPLSRVHFYMHFSWRCYWVSVRWLLEQTCPRKELVFKITLKCQKLSPLSCAAVVCRAAAPISRRGRSMTMMCTISVETSAMLSGNNTSSMFRSFACIASTSCRSRLAAPSPSIPKHPSHKSQPRHRRPPMSPPRYSAAPDATSSHPSSSSPQLCT